jgi:hypothetical protein
MEVIATGRIIGPTFPAELATAGLSAVGVSWRPDGVLTFVDGTSVVNMNAVIAVAMAHVANPTTYIQNYITGLGGNPGAESLLSTPGIGAVQPGAGFAFLEATVTLTGGLAGSAKVRAHFQEVARASTYGGTAQFAGVAFARATVPASSTRYASVFGGGLQAAEVDAQVRLGPSADLPVSLSVMRLRVVTATAQPGDGSLVVTVRDGGADTAVSVTIAAGGSAGERADIIHIVNNTGSDLSVKFVNNSASASAQLASMSAMLLTGLAWTLTPFAALLAALDHPTLSYVGENSTSSALVEQNFVAGMNDPVYGTAGVAANHFTAGDRATLIALAATYGITLV